MKLFFKIFTCLLLITAFQSQAFEIGVVDWREALFTSQKAKKINDKLQIQTKENVSLIKKLKVKIEKNHAKIRKDKELISKKQYEKLAKETAEMTLQHNELLSQLQQERVMKENTFIKANRDIIDVAIKELSKKHKLNLIINKSAVVYMTETNDLTLELRAMLNERIK